MTSAVFLKLLAVFITVAIGYVAGRMRWLGKADDGADPARVLSNVAFTIFVPALLFRTTARLDFAALPWRLVFAFFVPVVVVLIAVYAWQRWQQAQAAALSDATIHNVTQAITTDTPATDTSIADTSTTDTSTTDAAAAVPSTRAIGATFGNTVQLGIPLAAAIFGEVGLGIHITLVSLHALVLLSVTTALAELDLARARARARHEGAASLAATLRQTVRNTVVHPVVLPVLAGMLWNATGIALPAVVDEALVLLGSAVVPLCLVLIGVSLAYYGLPDAVGGAIAIAALKLLVVPAVVLITARWGFGLTGLPLGVLVAMASLPVGSNALIFAQRYRTLEAEATAAIVFSTLAFVATSSLWLAVVAWVG